nr:hypothetical protein [Tanacetum cinerariifolium]GFB87541.1 hypothetical protein [Tanacetum cinerariifolium]
MYGYDGLPMLPVAPLSPDYIPGPEEPQSPQVPHDEDEREPMLIQPHDPDYVPKPMYPENTVRLQATISLPPEAEVERHLAMPTPPPSPLALLSPPSAGERLARCMASSACPSPLSIPSPLLPSSGCLTHIQTLRMASTQALIDAVTAALPSHHYHHLYTYHHLLTVDRRSMDRLWAGYGIRDTWVDPVEAVPKIAPITVGEVNTRVTELAELYEHDTKDLYALLEDA